MVEGADFKAKLFIIKSKKLDQEKLSINLKID